MRGGIRAIRGVILFGYFLLDKQEKVALGAGREHPAFKQTPPAGRLDTTNGARVAHSFFNRGRIIQTFLKWNRIEFRPLRAAGGRKTVD